MLTSGSVGIGTDAPTVKLEVKNGDLIVGDGSSNGIRLTYSAGNSSGVINTAYSSDALEFRIGNSEKMRISSAGAIKFNAYDSTNQTGTPTYVLGTDALGNVVKVLGADIPGSVSGSVVH